MRDIEHDLGTVWWKRWVGAYNDRLGDGSKTHLTNDYGNTTLCGRQVPSESKAEVEGGGSIFSADCKRCENKMRENGYV